MPASLPILVAAALVSLFVAWAIGAGSSGATPLRPRGGCGLALDLPRGPLGGTHLLRRRAAAGWRRHRDRRYGPRERRRLDAAAGLSLARDRGDVRRVRRRHGLPDLDGVQRLRRGHGRGDRPRRHGELGALPHDPADVDTRPLRGRADRLPHCRGALAFRGAQLAAALGCGAGRAAPTPPAGLSRRRRGVDGRGDADARVVAGFGRAPADRGGSRSFSPAWSASTR